MGKPDHVSPVAASAHTCRRLEPIPRPYWNGLGRKRSWQSPRETEENRETPQSGQPRLEPAWQTSYGILSLSLSLYIYIYICVCVCVCIVHCNTLFYQMSCPRSTVTAVKRLYRVSQDPGGKINILGGHSIGHSKQKKKVYVHVSYSERFQR
jgi:hypothetical protein